MTANKVFTLTIAMIMLTSISSFGSEVGIEEVTKEQIRLEEVYEKVADNFIVLFDASGSMGEQYKDTGMTKWALANKILKERSATIPDLGYNAGMYLYTPWQVLYSMGPYSLDQARAAIDKVPTVKSAGTYAGQPTPLGRSLQRTSEELAGVAGRTAIFLFSDGSFSGKPIINPVEAAGALAAARDVCIYVISSAQTEKQINVVNGIAGVNQCSRVIPFESFINNPDFYTGALWVVKTNEATERIRTGYRVNDVRFDFDKYEVRPEFHEKLNTLGNILKENPQARLMLQGFTDSTGSREYNLELSRKRAEAVGDYLVNTVGVDITRLSRFWYGAANFIASNDTEDGRQMNRRVEVEVVGIKKE